MSSVRVRNKKPGDPQALIDAYKARVGPWTKELWDAVDEAYVERRFRRQDEGDD